MREIPLCSMLKSKWNNSLDDWVDIHSNLETQHATVPNYHFFLFVCCTSLLCDFLSVTSSCLSLCFWWLLSNVPVSVFSCISLNVGLTSTKFKETLLCSSGNLWNTLFINYIVYVSTLSSIWCPFCLISLFSEAEWLQNQSNEFTPTSGSVPEYFSDITLNLALFWAGLRGLSHSILHNSIYFWQLWVLKLFQINWAAVFHC